MSALPQPALRWQQATIERIALRTPRVVSVFLRTAIGPHEAGQHVDIRLTAPDGYDTNVPVADLTGGRAMIATRYDGTPLPAEHGGPARLLVPHLYFWKSAKWLKGLRFTEKNEAGFWELRGYHIYGDPWREQRYTNDP